MQNPEALIFDVDGTLADTERDGHRPAFNAAFREEGLDWDWTPELYQELLSVTGGKERIRHYIEHYRPMLPDVEDLDRYIAALHRAKTRYYTEMAARGDIPLRTGVLRLLKEARDAGLRLAIATTTTPENVSALLRPFLGEALEAWFEVIAAGDIVPAKKPAPDIYHHALEELGLAPERCLAFEDSGAGLQAAHGAGLRTVVTVNDYTCDHDFGEALLVLDHFGEPDQPFQVLQGDAGGHRWMSLDLIRELAGRGAG